jgi:hypothetical protein
MSSRFLMHRVFPPSKPPDRGYPSSFRLVVGGTQLRGSWYLSAIIRLQGFSSASPVVPLRRRSPETVTTILAGVEAGLSRSSTSRAGSWVGLSFGVRGRGCSLALRAGRTSTTRGRSTAGVVSLSASGSSAWLPVPPCRKAAAAPCAREDRPRYRALPGRRSCSRAVLPLHWYGASARRSVPHSSGRI